MSYTTMSMSPALNPSYTFPNAQQAQSQKSKTSYPSHSSYDNDEEDDGKFVVNQYNDKNDNDTEVLNKACSLNNSANQITSNYWKIPEHNYSYLQAISCHNDKPYLALANSSNESNLLIYELNAEEKLLSHHQSISLPNITSLKWLDSVSSSSPSEEDERNDINFLLTGHSKGIVHLSIIPEPENDVFANAEIIKRFNHNKHIDNYDLNSSSTITKMVTSPRRWKSCNMNSLLTICKSNVFMWDTSRSRAPILKYKSMGIQNFDPSPSNDGLLSICGEFGIALLDLRASSSGGASPNFYVPSLKNSGVANNIKWSPFDSNVLASSYEDGVVKLWDVRMTKNSFAKLEGHNDIVTSIEWSESATNDLFTSSKDGNIIHWDLSDVQNYTKIEDELKCSLRVGLDSVNLVNKNGRIELVKDLIHTRQCGTLIPASNNSIVDLVNIGDGLVLSIDGSSFLGLHNKTVTEPTRTSTASSNSMMSEILSSIAENYQTQQQQSNPPLVEDTSSLESLALPVTPKNQRSSFFRESLNKSNETLLNSPVSSNDDNSQQQEQQQQRVISTSTEETLVGSPVVNKISSGFQTSPMTMNKLAHFQTSPLPYYNESLDTTLMFEDVKLNVPKTQRQQHHKKSKSFLIRAENKLRDMSGNTLISSPSSMTKSKESRQDLLTDLSIEDDFTFKPVLPLSVQKLRPAF